MSQLLLCCSFVGPLEQMPFDGNVLHLVAVICVGAFFGTFWSKAGLLFSDHPDSPRTSMLKPVLQSLMCTFRAMDNFTDISTIRILVMQVCFWSKTLF
jgi:hypothetical protein